MSDIYSEKEDLKNIKSFTAYLRDEYQRFLANDEDRKDAPPDVVRLRTYLAHQWPGNEIVGQLVKDISEIMRINNIKPGEIK